MNVLAIDTGGTHVKVLVSGEKIHRKFSSGPTLTAKRMVAKVKKLAGDWEYDVIAMGYPGLVVHGRLVLEPHNLGGGSVISSWLLDLTADALAKDSQLSQFEGRVSDSGEGRWTIKAAIDEGVPVPVLTTALYERFASRGAADFQGKVLSAMRYGFGGHLEKPAK